MECSSTHDIIVVSCQPDVKMGIKEGSLNDLERFMNCQALVCCVRSRNVRLTSKELVQLIIYHHSRLCDEFEETGSQRRPLSCVWLMFDADLARLEIGHDVLSNGVA